MKQQFSTKHHKFENNGSAVILTFYPPSLRSARRDAVQYGRAGQCVGTVYGTSLINCATYSLELSFCFNGQYFGYNLLLSSHIYTCNMARAHARCLRIRLQFTKLCLLESNLKRSLQFSQSRGLT